MKMSENSQRGLKSWAYHNSIEELRALHERWRRLEESSQQLELGLEGAPSSSKQSGRDVEYRSSNPTGSHVTIVEDYLNKKPAPSKEDGLVWMIYRNPRSKDKESAQGIKVQIKVKERKQLLTQNPGEDQPSLQWCLFAPRYKHWGGWLVERYLSPVVEENEFGVVSP